MLENTRRASWGLLATVLLVHTALTLWINFYGFRHGLLDFWLLGGLLNATLEANLLLIAVVVVGLLLGVGRMRPKDLGLGGAQIVPTLIGGSVFWVALQLVAGLFAFISAEVILEPRWHAEGWRAVVGELVSQLFGNALYEEIVFRGFLPVQIWLLFRNHFSRHWLSTVLTLLIFQAIFSLGHLPNSLFVHQMPLADAFSSLESVFVLGVLFALLYLRTCNLLLVVAVHVLLNAPTSVFAASDEVLGYTSVGLMLLFIGLWKSKLSRSTSPVAAQP